jgi:small subunit ribosomal protein S6
LAANLQADRFRKEERLGLLVLLTTEEEEKLLREYELVMILDPEMEDEQATAAVDRMTQFVTSHGGEVTDVNPWGKRRLSYPIRSRTEGNYVITHFRIEPSQAAELEASLRLSEEVLRHLLVKTED